MPGDEDRPIAAHTVHRDDLPLRILLIDEDDGRLLHYTEIEDVAVLEIPGFAPRKVSVITIPRIGAVTQMRSNGDVMEWHRGL